MLRWEQTEFLLKGIYLGLLVLVAWQLPNAAELGQIAGYTAGGLALCLAVAAWRKFREGYRAHGRAFGFVLFLILENPGLVYAGLVGGLALGAMLTFRDPHTPSLNWDSLIPLAGGAVLGIIFYGMRYVRDRRVRLWLGLGMVLVLAGGLIAAFYLQPALFTAVPLRMIAGLLLAGLPGFYLLTFASLIEESEVEIAAMCTALAIGCWIFAHEAGQSYLMESLALVVPAVLYYLYTRHILPHLRVVKHALRGMSYRQVGNTRAALISLGRALQLDPRHTLARQQLWEIHRELDVSRLTGQPDIIPLLNFNLCLERVGQLLLQDRPPPEQVQEAHHLLDLIVSQQPIMRPCAAYWRSVALTHQKKFEEAAAALESVLQLPQQDTPYRQAIHFAAWQLALVLHPELVRRVGTPLLTRPGERLDAIAAVERQLAQAANDASAWDLKRLLYSELTEDDYHSATSGRIATNFDHEYTKQLGLALIGDRDRWERGAEYLRIAARGLPQQATGLYIQIAEVHERHADTAGMWANYQQAMHLGRRADIGKLDPAERKSLFAVVKKIGEQAVQEDRIDAALEAYKFYSQYDDINKVETYRTLADLFEKKLEFWSALNCVEHALTYKAEDRDLAERKDRLYFHHITPQEVKQRWENVKLWFDIPYCIDKARFALKNASGDLEMLDWAGHLAELAVAANPDNLTAKFLRARVARFRGEIPETTALLEDIRLHRPEKFASADDEESWYLAHRMLGDLYLDTKADQALLCFQEFARHSSLSGADTLFKMARAYENLGDLPRAIRSYEQVTGYEQHPLYYEARDALDRLRAARPQR